jgi:hypothetical protein
MVKVASQRLVLAAAVAGTSVLSPYVASGAPAGPEATRVAEAGAQDTPLTLGDGATLMLRFVQEDGPESGHVRVELTPELRPLTIFEARAAAQDAFLEALNEPGLGENLTRITVVVRLMPASHPDPAPREQVVVFQHKGGRDWAVLSGE